MGDEPPTFVGKDLTHRAPHGFPEALGIDCERQQSTPVGRQNVNHHFIAMAWVGSFRVEHRSPARALRNRDLLAVATDPNVNANIQARPRNQRLLHGA